jgi:hemerythrin-like domain-containing protein
MAEAKASDAPQSLILIHRVISRGLQVSLQHTETFARDGLPDPATGAGFALYLSTLAGTLYIHHSAEDEIAFPFLRDRLPDLPFDVLTAEHLQMEAILDEMAPILDRLQAGGLQGPALEAAHRLLAQLAKIWPGHIGLEESGISVPHLLTMITGEELGRWLQAMGQHRPEGAPPDPLVLPFILHNLSPEDRALMAQQMPPVVSQELVPVAWKEQWAPMKPFLLP